MYINECNFDDGSNLAMMPNRFAARQPVRAGLSVCLFADSDTIKGVSRVQESSTPPSLSAPAPYSTSMGDSTSGTTRSTRARKKSAPATKRKRSVEGSDSTAPCNKKMAGGNENQPETTSTTTTNFTFADLTHYLSTTHRVDTQKDIDEAVTRAVTKVTSTLEKDLTVHKEVVAREIDQIKACIARLDKDKNDPGTSYAAAAASTEINTPRLARALDLQSHETRTYWQFRKCARIHNVAGETEAEIWKDLQAFLRNKMKIPTHDLKENEILSVRRMRGVRGRGKQPVGEVVVVFVDVETRDRVCSYARNLAPFVDVDGQPTAGVRMYVPAHLGGVHKTLLQYGFNMRERYGRDFKRNIRFDDSEHSLCIDIRLPGKDSKWVSVSHAHALADKRAWTRSVEQGNKEITSLYIMII